MPFALRPLRKFKYTTLKFWFSAILHALHTIGIHGTLYLEPFSCLIIHRSLDGM
jgi:hypothetical protein